MDYQEVRHRMMSPGFFSSALPTRPLSSQASSGQARRAIEVQELRFSYPQGPEILNIKHFYLDAGEQVFLHGPSGSGKTTFLGLLAGVLQGAQGKLEVLGEDLIQSKSSRRDELRGAHMGYIFQMFNLVPYLTVEENILLPCQMSAKRRLRVAGGDLHKEAVRLAEALNIAPLLSKKATDLSVGQQQRVAAARALVGSPELIIADEPTSALDADHRTGFLKLLFAQCRERGASLLFVSHDASLMPLFSRQVSLSSVNEAAKGVQNP
jgi:putative ABC transport system ATP-binding protein